MAKFTACMIAVGFMEFDSGKNTPAEEIALMQKAIDAGYWRLGNLGMLDNAQIQILEVPTEKKD
jgi:hypothetical protein